MAEHFDVYERRWICCVIWAVPYVETAGMCDALCAETGVVHRRGCAAKSRSGHLHAGNDSLVLQRIVLMRSGVPNIVAHVYCSFCYR